jgi:hypothetical protein
METNKPKRETPYRIQRLRLISGKVNYIAKGTK